MPRVRAAAAETGGVDALSLHARDYPSRDGARRRWSVSGTLEAIDGSAVRAWSAAALAGLAAAREEIDSLNVYPVPDGDTGTNLYLTVEAAHQALAELAPDADLPTTVAALARAALLGARGNSGVILSQLLRGIAANLHRPEVADAVVFAEALERAVELGYTAVSRPVEGTMLTVARAAAEAAVAAVGPPPSDQHSSWPALARAVVAAADAARVALARTPDQLDVLRRAGVVDAGGRGLCVLFDALVAVVTGVSPAVPPAHPRGHEDARGPDAGPAGLAGLGGHAPAYEVMYLLDAADSAIPELRRALDRLGDSTVVVGGEGLWNVHVHVDDVVAAVEAGLAAGRPHRVRVTHFADESAHGPGEGEGTTGAGARVRRRAVVSVVAGAGLADLVVSTGAAAVRGGPGRRVSAAELLEGMCSTGAREVIVLPNDADSLGVAEVAARQGRKQGLRVAVVPSIATVQGLAALAVHDAARRFDDDVVQMTAAAGHCRHGGVTIAAKHAWTVAGQCRPGDVLGIIEGDFAIIGDDLARVACEVVDRMLAAGGELVTLVTGADADPALANVVVAHLATRRPDVEVAVHEGGQPRYPLLIGIE